MKSSSLIALIAAGALTAATASDPGDGRPEEVLDAPGGRPIAVLLSGSQPRVLEARDGYVRIVLEGWVRSAPGIQPAAAPPGSGVVPVGEAPPDRSPAAPQADRGAVSGRILVTLASGEVRKGSGARVVLLGNVVELEGSRSELAAAYQREAAALEAEIRGLEERRRAALSSSDNLGEATQRLDRAKRDLSARQRDLGALKADYASREGLLVDKHAVQELRSGPDGTFRFAAVSPGEYRLWALHAEGDATYRWYLPARAEAGGDLGVDLASRKPGDDPFLTIP